MIFKVIFTIHDPWFNEAFIPSNALDMRWHCVPNSMPMKGNGFTPTIASNIGNCHIRIFVLAGTVVSASPTLMYYLWSAPFSDIGCLGEHFCNMAKSSVLVPHAFQ